MEHDRPGAVSEVLNTTVVDIQDYVHPNDHASPTYELTNGFKPFTLVFS